MKERPLIDIEALRREARAGGKDDRVVVERGWLRDVLAMLERPAAPA